METRLIFTLEERQKLIFTIGEAKEILKSSDLSVWSVLNGLKRKNRIKEIERGKYLLSPAKAGLNGYWSEHAFTILPHILDTYYVSYWSALNYWGMTEQLPLVMYVVLLKRKSELNFDNQIVKFVTVNGKKFFGYTQEKIGDTEFNMATKEKTIIDCLDRLEYAGGIIEVAKGLWNSKDELNRDTLIDYGLKFGIESVQRRLGFLMDLLGLCDTRVESSLRKRFKGYHWLDYTAQKKVLRYDKKWGLKINIPEKELVAF